MDDEILPIPPIPELLRREAGLGKVIPFVGAGVSRLAGGPSWAEFANGALSSFIEQGRMNYATYEQMQALSPRIKLSMALELEKQALQDGGKPIDFSKLLHPTGDCSHKKGQRLYGGLSAFSRRFVTTNYDRWLDTPILLPTTGIQEGGAGAGAHAPNLKPQKRDQYILPHDFLITKFDRPNMVLHLHGSVEDRRSMILTTADYVRHYANDRRCDKSENRVLTLLNNLFDQYTVLFVGYGLDELEILEYVISNKWHSMPPEIKHFLLQGFFSHEKALMRELRTYYSAQCRITMIPYLLDELDWDQLLDVVDYFAHEIRIGDVPVSARLANMKELLNG